MLSNEEQANWNTKSERINENEGSPTQLVSMRHFLIVLKDGAHHIGHQQEDDAEDAQHQGSGQQVEEHENGTGLSRSLTAVIVWLVSTRTCTGEGVRVRVRVRE